MFALWVRIFEMPFFRANGDPAFDRFANSIWFTIITLFTVGYGDLYPTSDVGKLITIILALWGSTLLALLVVCCTNVFNIEGNQQMALNHMSVTRQAAKTVLTSIRYFQAKKKLYMLKYKNGEI